MNYYDDNWRRSSLLLFLVSPFFLVVHNMNKGGYLCSARIDFEVTDDEKSDKCFSIAIPSNKTQY